MPGRVHVGFGRYGHKAITEIKINNYENDIEKIL
jgi:hypothetical protein